jgi:hypothetical protein
MANKNGKKITIDGLAMIINKGFDGQMEYMREEFGKINRRFEGVALKKDLDEIKKDVKYIKENLKSASELEKEVDYIKNTLGVPELKG